MLPVKTTLGIGLVIASLLRAEGCSPAVVPPPSSPDASVTVISRDAGPETGPDAGQGPAGHACQNLAGAGCAEGRDPSCERVLQRAAESHLVPVDVACLVRETSRPGLRSCGSFVRCP